MITHVKADLDDMVFEDRERSYGAFLLRKRYPRHLMFGTLITCFAGLMFGMAPALARYLNWTEDVTPRYTQHVIDIETITPPPRIEPEKPIPTIPDLPPPQIRTVEFRIPDPTPESELDPEEEPTIADILELRDAPKIALETQEGAEEGWFDPDIDYEDVPPVIVDNTPGISDFIYADEEPVPVNMDDLVKLIGYPQIARDTGIEGSVVVRILVDKKGRYKQHKVINQVHPLLAKGVEKHLHKLTFTPAIQGGNPIQFWVNIPFKFHLMK